MESPMFSFNKCTPKMDSLFDSRNLSINLGNLGTEEERFEKYSV